MEIPAPPDTPSALGNVIFDASFTRDALPNTSSNLQRRGKRSKQIHTQVPAIRLSDSISIGMNKTSSGTAGAVLLPHLDEMVRYATLRRDIAVKLASTIDDFVAGLEHKDHRAIAKEYAAYIATQLRTQFFATSGSTVLPIGQPLSPPSSLGEVQRPPKQVASSTYASISSSSSRGVNIDIRPTKSPKATPARAAVPAKEDLRVLASLQQETAVTAPRLDQFKARTVILRAFALELADIPKVTHTATGYAIYPATKTIRDKLVSEEGKRILGRNLHCDKIQLPEIWFTYALTDVPYSFLGLTEGGALVETENSSPRRLSLKQARLRSTSNGPSTGRTLLPAAAHSLCPFLNQSDGSGSSALVDSPAEWRRSRKYTSTVLAVKVTATLVSVPGQLAVDTAGTAPTSTPLKISFNARVQSSVQTATDLTNLDMKNVLQSPRWLRVASTTFLRRNSPQSAEWASALSAMSTAPLQARPRTFRKPWARRRHSANNCSQRLPRPSETLPWTPVLWTSHAARGRILAPIRKLGDQIHRLGQLLLRTILPRLYRQALYLKPAHQPPRRGALVRLTQRRWMTYNVGTKTAFEKAIRANQTPVSTRESAASKNRFASLEADSMDCTQ